MGDDNQSVKDRLTLLVSHLMPLMPREDVLLHYHKNRTDDELVILNATKGKMGEGVVDQSAQGEDMNDKKESIAKITSNTKKRLANAKNTMVHKAGEAKDSSKNLVKDNTVKKMDGQTEEYELHDDPREDMKEEEKNGKFKGFIKTVSDKAADSTRTVKENIVGAKEKVKEHKNKAASAIKNAQGGADNKVGEQGEGLMRHQNKDKGLLQSAGEKVSHSASSVKSTIYGHGRPSD